MGGHVRYGSMVIAIAALLVAFLGLAAPSLADPGRPGLNQATAAVYPHPGAQQAALGAGGGGENAGPQGTASQNAAAQPVVGEGAGLPFTGFVAPLVLLAGLIAVALGLTLRMALAVSARTGTSGAP